MVEVKLPEEVLKELLVVRVALQDDKGRLPFPCGVRREAGLGGRGWDEVGITQSHGECLVLFQARLHCHPLRDVVLRGRHLPSVRSINSTSTPLPNAIEQGCLHHNPLA